MDIIGSGAEEGLVIIWAFRLRLVRVVLRRTGPFAACGFYSSLTSSGAWHLVLEVKLMLEDYHAQLDRSMAWHL